MSEYIVNYTKEQCEELLNKAKEFEDSLYFNPGDVFESPSGFPCPAFISSARKELLIAVPFSKSLDKVTNISMDEFKGILRINGTYVFGSSNGTPHDFMNDTYQLEIHKSHSKQIFLKLAYSSAITNSTNNTFGVIAIHALKLSFS